MEYRVNEIFDSIQGEGLLIGTPATFIRLQGCPVGCEWCDSGPLADLLEKRTTNGETKNTWGPGGTVMRLEDILAKVNRKHVIITGGEPTIWNLDPLARSLVRLNHFVQLETSGLKDVSSETPLHWITCSPKARLNFKVAPWIRAHAHEFKLVVDEALTYETVLEFANSPWQPVVLMPEGCPPKQAMIEKALAWIEINPTLRFSDRLQYRLGVR